MSGVEILAIEQVAIKWSYSWLAFWITFGLIFASFIALNRSCLLTGVFIGLIVGALFGAALGNPVEYENHYKVIVSDEVSMNDFYEHYKIIDEEGKIYTVREKE